MAAKTYDVDLSHSGPKIARKPRESKGGLGFATAISVFDHRRHDRTSCMDLRAHPLMTYRGHPNWPPVWILEM
jgi:hypothetical protein